MKNKVVFLTNYLDFILCTVCYNFFELAAIEDLKQDTCICLLFQKPGMLKGAMQKVNPFKSTSQVTTALPVHHKHCSTSTQMFF